MVSANNKITKVTKIWMQRTWKDAKFLVFTETYYEHNSLVSRGKSKHKGQFLDLNHAKLLANIHRKHTILFFVPKEQQQIENEQQLEKKQQNVKRTKTNREQTAKREKQKKTTANNKYQEKKQQKMKVK